MWRKDTINKVWGGGNGEWINIFTIRVLIRDLYPEYWKNSYKSITKTTQFKNGQRTLNRYFPRESIQMVNKHLKSCSKSLAIRQMQMKTTHQEDWNKEDSERKMTSIGKDVETVIPSSIAVGTSNGRVNLGNGPIFLQQQVNHRITLRSLAWARLVLDMLAALMVKQTCRCFSEPLPNRNIKPTHMHSKCY